MSSEELAKFFEICGVVLFDSALGTALQEAGQPQGARSEDMNISAPEIVLEIHKKNIIAGSDVITSNTFGVSPLLLRDAGITDGVDPLETLEAGVRIARQAADYTSSYDSSTHVGAAFCRPHPAPLVALCIGPTGALFEPFGDVPYETAEELFAIQAEAGARCGADFIMLETFADGEEFALAARAAKTASPLPVIGTMTFDASGYTFMGSTPGDVIRIAREQGLFAVGANCTLDPAEMFPIASALTDEGIHPNTPAKLHILIQPNAGQPIYANGQTTYGMSTEGFATAAETLINLGISAIGGCCGTTPAMISALRGIIDKRRNLL